MDIVKYESYGNSYIAYLLPGSPKVNLPPLINMTTPSAVEPTAILTKPQLLSDLEILSSNPSLLDQFLPAELRTSSDPSTAANNPSKPKLEEYSTTQANAKDSVALSYTFKEKTRDQALKFLSTEGVGDEGQIVERMGDKLDALKRDAEDIVAGLEGVDSA